MDDIDFFKDGRRVICQSLFSEMVHNEFEMTIRTEGRSHDFSEFVNGVDVAQNRCSVNQRWQKENYLHLCLVAICSRPNRVRTELNKGDLP